MLTQILSVQWKWARLMLAAATLLTFSLPALSVRRIEGFGGMSTAQGLLSSMQIWSPIYALTATMLGVAIGVLAWAADHRGRHVYALTLPLARWHYALMRMGSGVILLALPFASLLIGGIAATSSIAIPAGLHAYPLALATRFALASLVSFSLIFAISSGTPRTAAWLLGLLTVLIVGDLVGEMLNQQFHLLQSTFRWLFPSPGLFEVFTGRWMLIDV
jgi:hypothetical protein